MVSRQWRSVRHRVQHLTSWRPHDPWPVAAGIIAGVVAVPILVVLASLMVPQVETWTHLWQTQLPEPIGNTLALIVGVGIGVAVLGTGLAWLVTMHRFPGRDVAEWCLMLPLAVPAYVIALVFLAIFDYAGPVQTWWRHLFGPGAWFPDIVSYGGVALVMTCVSYPYVYILARAAFLEQSGATLEAARALGAGRFQGVLARCRAAGAAIACRGHELGLDGSTGGFRHRDDFELFHLHRGDLSGVVWAV